MSEKLQNALNEQITAELWSANLYLSMSFYLKKKVFQVCQLDAETICKRSGHACTIAEYMVKREATPKVDKVDVVPQGWGNSLEVFEHALEHEKHISKLIDELVYLASEEKDNATQDFLWKFVREQIEEEAGVQNIVNLLKKAGDSGILFIDANWMDANNKPE